MIGTIKYDLKRDFPQFLFYFLIVASISFLGKRDFGINPVLLGNLGVILSLFLLFSLKLNGTTEHFVTCHDFNQMIPKTSFEIIYSNVILTFLYALISFVILKGFNISVIFCSLTFICLYVFVSWLYIYATYKNGHSVMVQLVYFISIVTLISLFVVKWSSLMNYFNLHSLLVSTSSILLSFIGTFLFSRVMDNNISKEV